MSMVNWQHIGLRLGDMRRNREMTQQMLAERTGLSDVYIGYLEQGKRNGSIETFLVLVNALGYTMDDLLDEYITKRLPLSEADSSDLTSECSPSERELILRLVRDMIAFFRQQREGSAVESVTPK